MIREFQDQYRWLSNFAPVPIQLEGIVYASVEHAYQSAKSEKVNWKAFCSDPETLAGDVKRESRKIQVSENFNNIKLAIMKQCLVQKFNQEPYKTKLLGTGTLYIQEGNRWNDTYWGVCLKTNKGQNNLGKLIMLIRENIKVDANDFTK